jgi:YedE family putative selenium metabolism protein
LGGGDWNSLYGILGLAAGIGMGIIFLRLGFSLGRNRPGAAAMGWVMPLLTGVLLLALVYATPFGRDTEGKPTGPIFLSAKGPGSQHAAIWISLGAGLLVGFLAQRSRFCTVGALRDLMLLRDPHLFNGVAALIVAALATNLALGQFRAGFEGQPVAHTYALWNFTGMVLSGLAFTLAGGCPGRQLILSGEGDGDAAIFVLGMMAGAGFAHNFSLASSPSGPGPYGPAAVVTGLLVCSLIGLAMREPPTA